MYVTIVHNQHGVGEYTFKFFCFNFNLEVGWVFWNVPRWGPGDLQCLVNWRAESHSQPPEYEAPLLHLEAVTSPPLGFTFSVIKNGEKGKVISILCCELRSI